MMTWIAIALGGGVGAAARHLVNHAVTLAGGRPTPYATAVVNVSGCLVIGVLAGLAAHGRLSLSPTARAFVFVGILGGYTTFSTLALDTLTLASSGDRWLAAGNVLVQVALGLGGAWLGFAIGRP